MTPSPPDPFPGIHRHRLAAGTIIDRIHDSRFAANAFNPGLGGPTRFAPLARPGGGCIPHIYAAHGYECAAHETVFHEIQHDAARKTIAKARIDPLNLSRLRCRRDLSLCGLFQPDLNAWGIERAALIDTFASAYPRTVLWALAIHATHDVDGLIWTSRRCDPSTALILFGDRVNADDLEIVGIERIVASNPLFEDLRGFGTRAGITIVL